MTLPKNRKPTHPGEMLLEEFIKPMGLTQKKIAEHLGWTTTKIHEIVSGKRGLTADSALALADTFGIEPEFWLNLQSNWDLWHAAKKRERIKRILPLAIRLELLSHIPQEPINQHLPRHRS